VLLVKLNEKDDNMILIYGKDGCSYCERAKTLCESQGLAHEYLTMGEDYTREQLFETFPGAKTVPQIVVNGTKIGGYTELLNYIEETGYTGTGHTL
jgi:glutaredoxin